MPLLRIMFVVCVCLAAACAADPPRTENTPPPVAESATVSGYVHEVDSVTAAPVLLNLEEFGALLEREFPPALRAAGRGGRVTAIMVIDERGRVATADISRSSGMPDLDAATLRVVRQLRFRPARLGRRAVPVRVELPIDWTRRR